LGIAAALKPKRADECMGEKESGPIHVTPNCIDPLYSSPILDGETDETNPVPHRKVSGHFDGTGVDFNIYLPPKEQWQGRFFQHLYPLQPSNAEDYALVFGGESGGYTVQVSGSAGYRADAAVANLSRDVARKYYGHSTGHIYGYIYGGSGGSLQAVGAAEQTSGIWDGCVILIQAVPISIPYNWSIRALGALVLKKWQNEIIDSIRPGSENDLYSVLPHFEKGIMRRGRIGLASLRIAPCF
jgi:hypothetical protein